LPRTETIYLTRVHATISGDTCFPELSADEWHEVERSDHAADNKNPYDYSFIRLERV